MPIMPLKVLTEALKSFEALSSELAKMQKALNYLLEDNLDFDNIRAKGIIAENIDVDKLSAISADLGTITAGIIRGIEIYGSYIATAEGTYPRTEMDVAGDLLGAYAAANKYIRVAALSGTTTAPSLIFSDSGSTYYMYYSAFLNSLLLLGTGDISIGSSGRTVKLEETTQVTDWDNLYSSGDSQSLQQALSNKANYFLGYTGTITVIIGVDFGTSSVTTADLNFTNGILSTVT